MAFCFWPRPQLNVILITLGTTRADRIGCYGYQPAQTPALDALARRGALFERAYSSVPLTLPAHATIFTSLYPPEHGLHVDGTNRLGSDIPVLAEFLKVANYDTGAFLSAFALNAKFGLNRGFDIYDDALTASNIEGSDSQRRDGVSVMDAALGWLKARRARPFFCWIHFSDPHFPYDARPETFGDTFTERPYDAGIAYADLQVGRLTEFLQSHELSERTLIVVVGDHGEGLMEHGELQHGMQLYNSTLHVPLIVAGPDFIQPGVRPAVPVSHVDVAPTILCSLGIGPLQTRYRGTPLIPALAGHEIRPRVFHIETHLPFAKKREAALVGLVTAGWKYIPGAHPELYNLERDPGETNNVVTTETSQFKKFADWFRRGQFNMEPHNAPVAHLTSAEALILRREEPAAAGSAGDADRPLSDAPPNAQ
jgi:arylsulfatase A-like enzyme